MLTETLAGLEVRIVGGPAAGQPAGPLVVLLHGFGAPGTDLVGLAGPLAGVPGTWFAFPQAPLAVPFLGPQARAWWLVDVAALHVALASGRVEEEVFEREPPGLAAARDVVVALIEALRVRLATDTIILGGFSQGAMLACDVTFRSELPLVGLIAFSGMPIGAACWSPGAGRRRGLPALVAHGRADSILPFSGGVELRSRLERHGLDVAWVEFGGGHGIAGECVAAARQLIVRVAAPEGAGR